MAFSVQPINGLVYGQNRREVVFLASDGASGVNAQDVFNALKLKDQQRMIDKFDYWARGNDLPSHWFHGFTDDERKNCFVFKRRKGHTRYRYYGFLIHPTPKTDAGYRLCVLVRHGQKNTEETDPAHTDFVNVIRVRADVIAAVRKEFPENSGGTKNASLHIH